MNKIQEEIDTLQRQEEILWAQIAKSHWLLEGAGTPKFSIRRLHKRGTETELEVRKSPWGAPQVKRMKSSELSSNFTKRNSKWTT
ncbi:unnamed protein product [Lathyrus sativus]|nr:unnamed protein product [Lathyrus sativus]